MFILAYVVFMSGSLVAPQNLEFTSKAKCMAAVQQIVDKNKKTLVNNIDYVASITIQCLEK